MLKDLLIYKTFSMLPTARFVEVLLPLKCINKNLLSTKKKFGFLMRLLSLDKVQPGSYELFNGRMSFPSAQTVQL